MMQWSQLLHLGCEISLPNSKNMKGRHGSEVNRKTVPSLLLVHTNASLRPWHESERLQCYVQNQPFSVLVHNLKFQSVSKLFGFPLPCLPLQYLLVCFPSYSWSESCWDRSFPHPFTSGHTNKAWKPFRNLNHHNVWLVNMPHHTPDHLTIAREETQCCYLDNLGATLRKKLQSKGIYLDKALEVVERHRL